jgi:Uma2 family endonuclease
MNVTLRTPMTVEQFLAWEERQELRYEFDGVRSAAMTGGTFNHDAIQINLVTALHARLRGKRCRVHGSSLKIRVMGSIRYPDACVSCTQASPDSTVLSEPVVIFEVLSKSTAYTDRTVKNREYAGTDSVRRYVMLEQRAAVGTMFSRAADGAWTGQMIGPDTVIAMPEIGIDLPMADIYADVAFTGVDPAEEPDD